jgi:uncharacterized protein involved in exopolysaccharide biosynthesis
MLNLASLVSNLPIKGLGLNLGSNQVTSYLAILQSRTVREEVAVRFNLQEVYDQKDIEKTLEELDDNVSFTIGKEGQIVISVLDKSPERAANMANTFVMLLDSLNRNFKITRARNNRVLVEKRFNENVNTLGKVETQLKQFQEKHGVIDIPEQTKAAILGAAELQAQVYATEIELGVKEQYLKTDHASIVEGRAMLRELKRKLNEMEGSSLPQATNGHAEAPRLFIPFTQVPELGLQYARLYREVLVQNKLFEFLFQMYEQAKIQEAKDSPTVQVLDQGKVAIRKAKPKRMIMVLVAGLLSLVLTGIYVFGREYLDSLQAKGGETADKIDWIKAQMQHDVKLLRKRSS